MDADPRPPRRSPALAWLARGLALALAVTAATVGIVAEHRQNLCQDTLQRAGRIKSGTTAAEAAAVGRDLLARCPNPRDAVTPVALLIGAHHRDIAIDVAKGLTRRNPDDYVGWLMLSAVEGKNAQGRAAQRRVDQLRPPV